MRNAIIKFELCPRTIYRWINRYDGTLESLQDKSRKPRSHPNQHAEAEIKLIKDYKANNKETGLVVLWVKLREAGYTRTVSCNAKIGNIQENSKQKKRTATKRMDKRKLSWR